MEDTKTNVAFVDAHIDDYFVTFLLFGLLLPFYIQLHSIVLSTSTLSPSEV